MGRPIIKNVNAETGEEIVREMNDAELAQYEIDKVDAAIRIQAETDAIKAKAIVLERLGLTAEEAQLLLG